MNNVRYCEYFPSEAGAGVHGITRRLWHFAMATESHGYKVLLIGSTHVGKTSIIARFVKGEFREAVHTTPLPVLSVKDLQDPKSKRSCEIRIWDTAGSEDWQAMNASQYHGAQGVIFVASWDERNSLNDLVDTWLDRLDEHVDRDKYVAILAVNKSDLQKSDECVVTNEDIKLTAKKLKCESISVSAKTGNNVKKLFESMAALLMKEVSLPGGIEPQGRRKSCC
jgi:small GTP-binding protein